MYQPNSTFVTQTCSVIVSPSKQASNPGREVLEWPYTIGGGGVPAQTKVTIVRKNGIYSRENLVGPFLVHKFLGPRSPLLVLP